MSSASAFHPRGPSGRRASRDSRTGVFPPGRPRCLPTAGRLRLFPSRRRPILRWWRSGPARTHERGTGRDWSARPRGHGAVCHADEATSTSPESETPSRRLRAPPRLSGAARGAAGGPCGEPHQHGSSGRHRVRAGDGRSCRRSEPVSATGVDPDPTMLCLARLLSPPPTSSPQRASCRARPSGANRRRGRHGRLGPQLGAPLVRACHGLGRGAAGAGPRRTAPHRRAPEGARVGKPTTTRAHRARDRRPRGRREAGRIRGRQLGGRIPSGARSWPSCGARRPPDPPSLGLVFQTINRNVCSSRTKSADTPSSDRDPVNRGPPRQRPLSPNAARSCRRRRRP